MNMTRNPVIRVQTIFAEVVRSPTCFATSARVGSDISASLEKLSLLAPKFPRYFRRASFRVRPPGTWISPSRPQPATAGIHAPEPAFRVLQGRPLPAPLTMDDLFPAWTMLPFAALVLGIAGLPLLFPHAWGKHGFQALFACGCAAPVVAFLWIEGHHQHLKGAAASYASFVATIGALYVTASGIFVSGDIEATPRTNLTFLVGGALLASVIGTTGASILLIRPLLRTNQQRVHRQHLVPFFILAFSNAGGLLTPLGDPPLLLGYLEGVPFLWTLRLFPYWVLYVGVIAVLMYLAERAAYRREPEQAKEKDRIEAVKLGIHGKRNIALLFLIVGAVLLPPVWRESAIVAIAAASYFGTPLVVHESNGFSFGPILEVGILFA